MKRELRNCKTKMAEQQKQFHEYASRMDDYDKKNEETSRKFSTLLQVSFVFILFLKIMVNIFIASSLRVVERLFAGIDASFGHFIFLKLSDLPFKN